MTQQKEIARVNGYIEEMLNGQKDSSVWHMKKQSDRGVLWK